MAVLGSGGVLEISREIPDAMALTAARLNASSISLANQAYWAGDRIIIAATDGVPFDVNGDGYADCPDGHGIYRGGAWDTGISRSFYAGAETNTSPFYSKSSATTTAQVFTEEEDNESFYVLYTTSNLVTQSEDQLVAQSEDLLIAVPGFEDQLVFYDDTAGGDTAFVYSPYTVFNTVSTSITTAEDGDDFYNNPTNTGLSTQIDGYMSRDELDRIKLWTTEGAAHSETGTEKPLVAVKPSNFIIAHYDNDVSYTSALDVAASSIRPLTLPDSEQRLEYVISLPAGFGVVCENRDWKLQCDLQEWVMSIDASNLDTTAIGETFGENIKSLVRGAGSLQFLAEHSSVANEEDGIALLRLVLLTQNQCNTRARFHIYKDRSAPSPRIDGSVYYECDILLTNTRLNTRATEIIAGTADFVATSEIKLKVAA